MSEHATWIVGSIIIGLLGLIAFARVILQRIDPQHKKTWDDAVLEKLPLTEDLLRGLAAALGIQVKAEDDAKTVRKKVVKATQDKTK